MIRVPHTNIQCVKAFYIVIHELFIYSESKYIPWTILHSTIAQSLYIIHD